MSDVSQYDDPDRSEREPGASPDAPVDAPQDAPPEGRPGPWERPYPEPDRSHGADGGWASPSGDRPDTLSGPYGPRDGDHEPTRPQPPYDPAYQPSYQPTQ